VLSPDGSTTCDVQDNLPADDRADTNSVQHLFQTTRNTLLNAKDLNDVQKVVAEHLQRACQPTLLVWHYPSGRQIGQAVHLEGLLAPIEGASQVLRDQLKLAATECLRRNDLTWTATGSELSLAALPIGSLPGHCLLLITQPPASLPITAEDWNNHVTTSLLMLSSFIGEWALQRAGRQNAQNAATVAALIELVAHVQSANDSSSGCQRLADSLQGYLHADRVVVGLCRSGRSDVKVAAISGGAVIDPFSEETRLVESALQESLIRTTSGVWPVLEPSNRHALLSHQQLAESGYGDSLVSMPIQTESGDAMGCILVTLPFDANDATATDRIREAERFLLAGAGALAGCLGVLQKVADSRWLSMIQGARGLLSTSRLQLAAWLTGAVAMVLMLPMTYRIHCELELQPVERRYVAAPFDGPLEQCLVEPGDVVAKDQLLAQMDGREIRWELAEVHANLNKATKERNTQLSKKEFGNAAISGHEMQRLEQRAALLQHRNASLEIRSPADGVVVSGDHREAEGVPLEMGKTLFEIAPLDAMVVELCVPEEDIRHVQIGMTVDIQLEATPEDSITAVIRSIHPRAEIRDGKNVFIAEADIPNHTSLLRPGMRGSAHVNTRRHALGWNLFHKPAAWLLGWLGW
jgi:multidrug efflux pump subunit AcrA (membrane-fusion protein)